MKKKLLAIVLTVVMVLAGTVTAFAEAPTTGSITVADPNEGQTYTLYKLFDAEITFNEAGVQQAINYTTTASDLGDGSTWFNLGDADENGKRFVTPTDALTGDVMKTAAFIDWARSFGTQVGSPIKAEEGVEVKWDEIGFGYYFVDSTLGSFVAVDTVNPDATVVDKNNPPSIDKEITGVENGAVKDDANKTSEDDNGKNEAAIAQVGDEVSYKLTVKAQPGALNYVVTDTLSAGLTAPAAEDVVVSSGAGTYAVDVTGQVITVTFTKAYLDTITTPDTEITITYTAVLNDGCVVAGANPNEVTLTWGNDPSVNHDEDDAKVYTAEVDVIKVDGDNKPLERAGFKLQKGDKFYKMDNGKVTWVDEDDADEIFTVLKDGKATLENKFEGLSNGEYTLVETTVPDGYNKVADQTITISDSDFTVNNLSQSATVQNNAGQTMPSTGGMGTTILYTLGGLLVVGAGVLLVARRKMDN